MTSLKLSLVILFPAILSLSVIDADIVIPDKPEKASQPTTTVFELISMTQQLSDFHELIQDAGLEHLLQDNGPVTLFAPVNSAFEALSAEELEAYRQDQEALQDLLTHHIYKGALMSQYFSDGQELEMVNGRSVILSANHMGFEIDGSNIIQIDVEASNGLIHVVNEVLIPDGNGE
jgi:uncharacterized surface protein with fasciclin (FAS1) repeats